MTALEIKLTKPGWKHPEWSVGGRLCSPKIRTIPGLKIHHPHVYAKALEAQMGNDKGNWGLSFVFSMEEGTSSSEPDWEEAVSCQRGSKELTVITSLIFSNSFSFSCLSSPPTFTNRQNSTCGIHSSSSFLPTCRPLASQVVFCLKCSCFSPSPTPLWPAAELPVIRLLILKLQRFCLTAQFINNSPIKQVLSKLHFIKKLRHSDATWHNKDTKVT